MAGTPTMFPTLLYRDVPGALGQLTEAFGFAVAVRYDGADGQVLHAELAYGDGVVMVGSKGRGGPFDEAMKGAGPSGVYVVVEDPDEHCERARRAGVEILVPPTDQDYGARDYLARDAEGNVWSFGTYRPGGAG
ncbi:MULTISPECIES: VOC family protein [Streptomyces]|uniref:Glyoxalase n=1 Tax=Streptomyces noursei TaxID=1971 RepID=A0A2N8PL28_STRNR|nr:MULTISPECIES: VOC family protein [Streptomyces]PNE41728.1 glyoxalase [Streptomyces noursei]QRX91598.1 VOC family protein [Streptomyces noursei]UJB41373.1 VOC family protein [Streptomyces sp. A1-5]